MSVALLLGAAVIAYVPAMRAGYVRFDDTDYIEQNHMLRTAPGLAQIWTSPLAYPPGLPHYPVTFSIHWLEFRAWGNSATGYHVVNIGLHAINGVLVWLVLRSLAVPGALFAALLFAVHPVQAQSVAWLAERKNVLAALFYLVTVLGWLRFVRTGSWLLYALALVTFLLGLLSKTVICTLPIALLLLIWWRRPPGAKRLAVLVLPFLGLAIVMGAVVIWRENTLLEGVTFASGLSLAERVLIAGRGLWFYVGKLLVPVNLVPVYPHWKVESGQIAAYLYPLAVAAVVAAAWLFRRRVGRAPLVAVLFFVVTLAPTSGLVDFGYLAKSFVGDHYLYIPSVALFAGMATLGATLARHVRWAPARYAVPVVAAGVAGGLGVLTWRQCEVYEDAETFWGRVVAQNPSPTALSALGDAYLLQKDLEQAEHLLRRALAQRDSARTRFRLGCLLIERRQIAAAAEQFERALWLNRTRDRIRGLSAQSLANLGFCYRATGDYARAADAYRQAADLDPSLTWAREAQAAVEQALRRQQATTTPATQPR